MKKIFIGVVCSILGLVLIGGLLFGAGILDLKWMEYFGTRREGVRRKIFKETRSYNEAKLQQLSKYRLEYLRAEGSDERRAIASTIRHSFADYNSDELPDELKKFLDEVRNK